MANDTDPKGPLGGVLNAMQNRLSGLRKPDKGISSQNIVDPAAVSESNTLLGKHVKLLAEIQQQHVAMEAHAKYAKQEIAYQKQNIEYIEEKIKASKQVAGIIEVLANKENKYSAAQKDKAQSILKTYTGLKKELATAALGIKNTDGALKHADMSSIDFSKSVLNSKKFTIDFTKSLESTNKELSKLEIEESNAAKSGTLLQKQMGETGANLVHWFANKLPEVMEKWGKAGKTAANNYITATGDITDASQNMGTTAVRVGSKMVEVQKTIFDVSLEGSKLGYSMDEASQVVNSAMNDIAISSKGALAAADFRKLGEDTLFFSRVLGTDTTKTLKFFKNSMQKLNKTEREAADDLMDIRSASDGLNKSVGKTVIKSNDFADMLMDVANNSNRATLNMKSLSNISATVGAEMTKAGLSTEKTAQAMKNFTEFLAKPAEEIDVTAGFKAVNEYTKVAKLGQEDLKKYVEENFKAELDGIKDTTAKEEKRLQIEKAIKEAGDEQVGTYSRAKAVQEALGGTQKGMEENLRAMNELYIKGGGKEAAAVLAERVTKGDYQQAVALAKLMKSGDITGAAKLRMAQEAGAGTPEAKAAGIKGNVEAAGVFAGGIDNLPTNIWNALTAHPVLMGILTGLGLAAATYLKINALGSTINATKAFLEFGKKLVGGGGATGAAEAAAGAAGKGGATALAEGAAGATGKTILKSVLGKVGGGLLAGGIRIGEGVIDYSNASTDEERHKIVGETAGGATGTTVGGGLGMWGGAALGASLGSVVPILGTAAGGIIGGIIGAGLGGKLGNSIGEAAADKIMEPNVAPTMSDMTPAMSDIGGASPGTAIDQTREAAATQSSAQAVASGNQAGDSNAMSVREDWGSKNGVGERIVTTTTTRVVRGAP